MSTSPSKKRVGEQCVSVTLPELLQLANSARQLSLSHLRVSHGQTGQHLSRFLGRGMEFAESRLYQAGDAISSIDWRVTARAGKAHTKLFTAEKERQVLLGVDMRSAMFFATQGVFKSVQAALMVGYIAWSTTQAGNRLGGLIFDDSSHLELRPALGKKGLLPLLQGVAEKAAFPTKPKAQSIASASMMDAIVSSLARVAAPGSLIYLISDFRSLSLQSQDLLMQLSRHCDICLCFIYDPFEANLPKNGLYPLTDGRGELYLNTFDRTSLEKYRQQFVERKGRVRSLGLRRHVHFLECCTEEDCFEVLKKARSSS